MLTKRSVPATDQENCALVVAMVQPQQFSLNDADALVAFANFLARDMKFDLEEAQRLPLWWYQEQVGADICSLSRAATLRGETMKACIDHQAQLLRERTVARSRIVNVKDEAEAPAPKIQTQETMAQEIPLRRWMRPVLVREEMGFATHRSVWLGSAGYALALGIIVGGGVWIVRHFS